MIKNTEKAILVGISTPEFEEKELTEHLDELEFLAQTAGASTVKRFTQNLQKPHSKYYTGTGKLEEIAKYIEDNKIDMVIYDAELSPSLLKNIEAKLKCKILDRNNLILDIFASNAKTAQAKTQVELAQYEYLLPRLSKMWTHLHRQKGGIGMKGPGEKEIETDRRIVRDKISLLKEKLLKIERQNTTQRKARKDKIRVALVGYTNAGKSTVMNLLSDATVLSENKLFATLDTTVRKVVIETTPFLLSDTVGFIRKLPHSLVESFKSTLEEAREADILIHVADISHPQVEKHIEVVNKTLAELGAANKPILLLYNKIDAYQEEEVETESMSLPEKLKYLENTYFSTLGTKTAFMAANVNFNTHSVREKLLEMINELGSLRNSNYASFLPKNNTNEINV